MAIAPAAQPPLRYAGFWRRTWALLIDLLVLALLWAGVSALGGWILGRVLDGVILEPGQNQLRGLLDRYYMGLTVAMAGTWWLYLPVLEATPLKPLGKRLLGITVLGAGGRRVGVIRSTLRHLMMPLSGLFCFGIGFLMAGMTRRKQALHDSLTGCVLVVGPPPAPATRRLDEFSLATG